MAGMPFGGGPPGMMLAGSTSGRGSPCPTGLNSAEGTRSRPPAGICGRATPAGLARCAATGPDAQAVAESAQASRAAVARAGVRQAREAGLRSWFPDGGPLSGRTGRAGMLPLSGDALQLGDRHREGADRACWSA